MQSAITAVPADASLSSPYLVMVMPGVYSENVVIEKAGITVLGVGRVVLTAAGAAPTITVQSSVSTTPTSLNLKNIVIDQPNSGQACVSIVGASGSAVFPSNSVMVPVVSSAVAMTAARFRTEKSSATPGCNR